MKKTKKNLLIYLILFFTITSILFSIWHYSIMKEEESIFRESMKIASIAINESNLEKVNEMIINKDNPLDILNSREYKNTRFVLEKLTSNFPSNVLWSYIMLPIDENDIMLESYDKEKVWIVLSVLTIETDINSPETLPGYIYDVSSFPEIIEVLNGADFSYSFISSLDEDYGVRVKTGVQRIYNMNEEVIGILGMDKLIFSSAKEIISAFIASIVYGFLITSFIFISLSKVRIVIIKKAPKN